MFLCWPKKGVLEGVLLVLGVIFLGFCWFFEWFLMFLLLDKLVYVWYE